MRKLASIRKVDDIRPIEGADAIECAVVGGWTVVVKKGEYNPGDLAVYCEIDSWIPVEIAPFLVKGKEPREFEGVKGERLKTIKLRGQLSQGLLLPLFPTVSLHHVDFNKYPEANTWDWQDDWTDDEVVGLDLTDILGIKKWEKAIPAQLAGQMKGNFPTAIPKTDQERCQNLVKEIVAANEAGTRFEITEKLEGSSMTCYLIQGEFGVCSRNMDLKETEGNSFWATARKEQVEVKMRAVDEHWDFAIQGELIGPGIQGNIYNLKETEFRVFDVYNIQTGAYLDPAARRALIDRMDLKHVPVLVSAGSLYDTLGITDIPQLLQYAEGKSVMGLIGCEREGVVFKEVNGGMSFKAISNKYLLGEK